MFLLPDPQALVPQGAVAYTVGGGGLSQAPVQLLVLPDPQALVPQTAVPKIVGAGAEQEPSH